MKTNLLPSVLLFAGWLLTTLPAVSQLDDSTYAVTDSIRNGIKWNFLRTLDLKTGTFNSILLPLLASDELISPTPPNIISCNGSAAIAYDKRNKRLYYTPMLTDRLAYIDLRTMRNIVVTSNFTGLMPKASDQSNIVTRMFIGDGDRGYALTNDGQHLFTFVTKNNPAITDLGSLVDDPANNGMSIHNGCSSFGGDIIADNAGNLYLFTFGKNVFKIDISTKVAQYIGAVTGLPDNFTISGAVVDKTGEKIVVVSSIDASDVYFLNIQTLVASRLNANNPWLASDLANGFLLKTKKPTSANLSTDHANLNSDKIHLYPNPVTERQFTISFTNVNAGLYTISVMNVDGKSVMSKLMTLEGKLNSVSINLPKIITNGIYIVKVTDNKYKSVYEGKIVVQ